MFGRKFITDLYLRDSFDWFDGIRSLRAMVRSFQASLFHLAVTLFHNIVGTFHESLSYKQIAETRVLLMCVPRSLSHKHQIAHFTTSFTLKLWNDLTIKWNDQTGNDLPMKSSDCKMV